MRINADNRTEWPGDIARSVEMYNEWYRHFAPAVFRRERTRAADAVIAAMGATRDFAQIDATTLLARTSEP